MALLGLRWRLLRFAFYLLLCIASGLVYIFMRLYNNLRDGINYKFHYLARPPLARALGRAGARPPLALPPLPLEAA